jgi:hypothetical protein
MTLPQLGGDVLLRITRIVKQDNFSRSLSNCKIVEISFRKVGLKALALKNFSTPGEDTHAVGCCFQGNYFEPTGPAEGVRKLLAQMKRRFTQDMDYTVSTYVRERA